MPANYPTTAAVFTTKNDGDVIAAAHINALQDEIAAIEASLIGGALPNPQRIVGSPATLVLDPGSVAKGRVFSVNDQTGFTQNITGSPGTNLDDISKAGCLLTIFQSTLYYQIAVPGANPRPIVTLLTVDNMGALVASGLIRTVGGFYERGRTPAMGEWVDVPFNAGDYTASAGSWTVPTGGFYRYSLIGKTMVVAFNVSGTTSTTPTTLGIRIPGGFVAAPVSGQQAAFSGGRIIEGAPQTPAGCYVTGNSNLMTLHKLPVATIIAGAITVQGSLTFEIQ